MKGSWSNKVCWRLVTVLVGLVSVSTSYGTNAHESEPVCLPLLKQILQLELPQTRVVTIQTHPSDSLRIPLFHLANGDNTLKVHLYKPTQHDLDGDGRSEIIIGFQFIGKPLLSPDIRDFLAVYTLNGQGTLRRIFKTCLASENFSQFTDLGLSDFTGDGIKEICFRYNHVSAGMIRWEWKETFYLIHGRPPFSTLLKLAVREGWGNVKGEGHARRSELKFEDLDGDDAKEILVRIYEGDDDEDHLKRTTETPIIYGLHNGQYKKLPKPPAGSIPP